MFRPFAFDEIRAWTHNFQRFIYITVQTKQAQPSQKYLLIIHHPYNKQWKYISFCRTFYNTEDVCDMIEAIASASPNYKISPKAREFISKHKVD